jgi:heterodisulfide reductase subunit D
VAQPVEALPMSNRVEDFIRSLDERTDAILHSCTACGACADVCPTPAVIGLKAFDPKRTTSGVRDLLAGRASESDAEAWAKSCCGSGCCLSVCPEGINPRFMLAMARRRLKSHDAAEQRRATGKAAFQKMGRGVKILSRLALPKELLARLTPSIPEPGAAPPDLVFYTGCNMLKTPHIGLLCLDTLDRLGLTYDVQGGPGACCGILQSRPGDTEAAGRQAFNTLDKLAASKTATVISWCPTCQIQFGETMIPSYRELMGSALDMTMFPVFLASRLKELVPMMKRTVRKRVAIYEYAGELGVMEAVHALLDAVPGVEIVQMDTRSIGYTGIALAPLGEYQRETIRAALDEAEAKGVDTFVGIYHGDHREFAGHENARPFRVSNYMELVGESMGLAHRDRFKELKLMQDADRILAESMDMVEMHGLDAETVRDVIIGEMLGDQVLGVSTDEVTR